MKTISFSTMLIAISLFVHGQHTKTLDSSLTVNDDKVKDNNQEYDYYQYILRQHDPILYLTFLPLIRPLEKRTVPLRQQEGVKNYILEGNVTHRITIYRGKYYSGSMRRKLRWTFDAAFNLRMTRDDSSPLLPQNNVIGLGLDYLLSNVKKLQKENVTSHWMTLQAHHYSNGQAGPFSFSSRNNYNDGDFSTNYIRLFGNSMHRMGNQLWTASYGYQRDLDIGGPLTVTREMWGSYGFNRLLLNLQWLREPYYSYANQGDNLVIVNRRIQWMARAELGYIFGDGLENFTYQKKYPLSGHLYLSCYPWVTNNLGFVFHGYLGRDYMNIRYDDPIYSGQLGMVLSFNQLIKRN